MKEHKKETDIEDDYIKTDLVKYSFDISKSKQFRDYKETVSMLKSWGYSCFNAFGMSTYNSNLRELPDECEVRLDRKWVTDDQWNALLAGTQLRLFDWREYLLTNKSLKIGYYLKRVPEMLYERDRTWVCGYTGKQVKGKPEVAMNLDALESPSLNFESIQFCRYAKVTDKKKKGLSRKDLLLALPVWMEAQKRHCMDSIRDIKEHAKSELASVYGIDIDCETFEFGGKLGKEISAKTWLAENGCECALFDNLILYDSGFVFGWRDGWRGGLTDRHMQYLESIKGICPFEFTINSR